MFVGHYAVSLALKSREKRASLGLLFFAVQFLDLLFFPLVLLGIERMNLIENFTPSTHFELEYMPYSHGLVASILLAALVYATLLWLFKQPKSVAFVVALAVFSHWVLDLIVHTPDLPILGDSSMKLGFGLWNNAMATYLLEAAALGSALWLYVRNTIPNGRVGKYGMAVFAVVLLLVNAVNIFGPFGGDSLLTASVSALAAYLLFAGVAFWLDGKRS